MTRRPLRHSSSSQSNKCTRGTRLPRACGQKTRRSSKLPVGTDELCTSDPQLAPHLWMLPLSRRGRNAVITATAWANTPTQLQMSVCAWSSKAESKYINSESIETQQKRSESCAQEETFPEITTEGSGRLWTRRGWRRSWQAVTAPGAAVEGPPTAPALPLSKAQL